MLAQGRRSAPSTVPHGPDRGALHGPHRPVRHASGGRAQALLALQRSAGNRAVTAALTRPAVPSPAPTVQRAPAKLADPADKSVNWYADDRNPTIHFVEMRSNDRSDTERYFSIGGVIYRYDLVNDQYVNAKNNDLLWDPVANLVVKRLRTDQLDYYQCTQRGVLSYANGRYVPMDLLQNFNPGDLLYGKETERALVRGTAQSRSGGKLVTADQYNREVIPATSARDPNDMTDEARAYHQYLLSQGPSATAIVDPGSGLENEERLRRSCVAMIDYKTGQGCRIHFELRGVDLVNDPQYYTETELRFILENRNFLNIENVRFYRDGRLVPTEQVVTDHELLVDEILDKGRVEPGHPYSRIVADPVLGSYDKPPVREVSPPLHPFALVRVGHTITGTRQQLWQRFWPYEPLPRIDFSGSDVRWCDVDWRCTHITLNQHAEDVFTLRRLS